MRQDAFGKCHPLVNFLFFVGAIGFGVVIQHPAYIGCSIVSAAVYLILLKGRKGLSFAGAMVPLFLIITFVNPLFNHEGSVVLFTVFGSPYTLEALYYGMAVAGIFLVMMLWFACYNEVLTSDKFICLFGGLIPSLSMVLVMVLRMIPNLIRKASQLRSARNSIGKGAGDQSTGKEKLQDGMRILSGLTDWALEGSIVTADSMRCRGYGTTRRTNFHLYRMCIQDFVVLGVMVVCIILALLAGDFDATYTPELFIARPGHGLVFYTLYLLIPTILHSKEALKWHISISRI